MPEPVYLLPGNPIKENFAIVENAKIHGTGKSSRAVTKT
jgi:hypothetical protein